MSIREGFNGYYNNFGIAGLMAICSYRLVGWPKQISSTPRGFLHPVHLRVRTTDVSTYEDVLLNGAYEFSLPFSPKVIVDVGANIGMASIYFAKKYPQAKIIAIEAEPSNFEVLAKNARPYPSILPVHAALWSRGGEINVCAPDPASGAFGNWGFITHEGPGRKVQAITMRMLMETVGIQFIDLLKVDIEGAEKEVFEHCDWVGCIRCLIIEMHDRFRPGCSSAVNSAMKEFSRSEKGETTVFLRHTDRTALAGTSTGSQDKISPYVDL